MEKGTIRNSRRTKRGALPICVIDDAGKAALLDEAGYARWSKARLLKRDDLPGDVCIATSYIGLKPPAVETPVHWETYIRGGARAGFCAQHPSRRTALLGHSYAVALAREEEVEGSGA